MKRKFLILSAALLAVVGAAVLQSCSSEYEYYEPTSEYGYYTEEEIEYINNIAKQMNVNVEANPEYYGQKPSIAEIEAEIRGLASLIGTHKITSSSNDSTSLTTTRGDADLSRTKSRSLEAQAEGHWYCIDQSSINDYVIDVDIKWNLKTNPQQVSGSATVQSYKNSQVTGQSNLKCQLSGTNVLFSGQIKSSISSKYKFHFEIVHGTLCLVTCTGNFDVISY